MPVPGFAANAAAAKNALEHSFPQFAMRAREKMCSGKNCRRITFASFDAASRTGLPRPTVKHRTVKEFLQFRRSMPRPMLRGLARGATRVGGSFQNFCIARALRSIWDLTLRVMEKNGFRCNSAFPQKKHALDGRPKHYFLFKSSDFFVVNVGSPGLVQIRQARTKCFVEVVANV